MRRHLAMTRETGICYIVNDRCRCQTRVDFLLFLARVLSAVSCASAVGSFPLRVVKHANE